jgi:hypothetical protein
MSFMDQVRSNYPNAKLIQDSWTFRGWLMALVPLIAYAFQMDPAQLTSWMDITYQLIYLSVILGATMRRQDIKVPGLSTEQGGK